MVQSERHSGREMVIGSSLDIRPSSYSNILRIFISIGRALELIDDLYHVAINPSNKHETKDSSAESVFYE